MGLNILFLLVTSVYVGECVFVVLHACKFCFTRALMWVGGWEFLISFTFARRMRVYKISRLMQNKCLFHGGIYTEHTDTLKHQE